MESNRSKRERGKNYTEREKQYVLEIARKYIDVIDAKQTDAGTNKRKNDAWDKIAEEFNPYAENGPRTGIQMKTLYHSMKKLVRRNLLNGNKDYVSVGDPLESNDLSENETYDNVRSFTPKLETDDDSCFEVTENIAGASDENSCSFSNFNAELINNRVKGQNNFSTPAGEDKQSNEANFNKQRVQLNFNNISDISQSSTAREDTNVHKRERGRNYSEVEKIKFLNIIAQYADIIESKDIDMKTMKRKNEAWNRIMMEYNGTMCTGTGDRTKDQLKHLYFGLKRTNKNFLKSTNQDSEQSFQNTRATSTPLQSSENACNYEFGTHRNFENIGNNPPDSSTNFDKPSANQEDRLETVGVKTEQPSFNEAEPPSPENTLEQEQQTQILPQHNQSNNENDEEDVHQEQPLVVQQLQELPAPEPSTKRKKGNSDKSYREQVEKIKYEMLLVRKEKEEIERDILLLELRKKELDIKEKEFQLRNMNLI